MPDPPPQQDVAMTMTANDTPSNERIIFGSDSPSEDLVEALDRETAEALGTGVASLPGNVDAPDALVETIMKPYRKNMDVLERFCTGSIFTIDAHSRARQDEIVTTLQKLRKAGAGDSVATLMAESRSTANDDAMEEDEMVEALCSADDVPTEEQVAEAQKRVADLRIRLAQLQRQKEALARQAEAWTDLNFMAAAGITGESKDGDGDGDDECLVSPDEAAKVHDLVSSAVVGTSMLTDLHQQGSELLEQLQDRSKNTAGGSDMEEEEEEDERLAIGRIKPRRKTLEEQYAEDRAVLGSGEGPPSAAIKQLLRQLRSGKENAIMP
jgi:hypothetical protein